ncbi:MAG: PilN domain-containing protein [bacterium]
MIVKFNLLPIRKTEEIKEEKRYIFLKLYVFLLSFLLLGMGIYFFKSSSQISSLEKIKKEKEETLAKYRVIAQKVKKMEIEREELKKRIETIVTLKAKQGRSLKNLYTLLAKVNTGKLIFTHLKIEHTKANIKGMGLDMDFLALYLDELEKSTEIIKGVNLKTAQQTNIGNINFINFEVEVQF